MAVCSNISLQRHVLVICRLSVGVKSLEYTLVPPSDQSKGTLSVKQSVRIEGYFKQGSLVQLN